MVNSTSDVNTGSGRVAGAWVTLITKPSYLQGLLTLQATLKPFTSYPLVAIVTAALPESSREIIRNAGIQVKEIASLNPVSGRHELNKGQERFADTWTKLRVFELVEYERAVLIDCDMIFLRSLDYLFEMPMPGKDWIGAAPACTCNPFKIAHYPADWVPANCAYALQNTSTTLQKLPEQPTDASPRTHHLLNSGLVVLTPSLNTLNEIIETINTSPKISEYKFPDQDLLADMFRGRLLVLPWFVNALKTLRAVHSDLWKDDKAALIHYILGKPWEDTRPVTPTLPPTPTTPTHPDTLQRTLEALVAAASKQTSVTNYEQVHAWWWHAYERVLGEMQRVEGSGWEEVDRYVTH